MKIRKFDVAIILSALSIIVVFAATPLTELHITEFHWIAHVLAGIFSLMFSIVTVAVGAMLTGRIKRVGTNLFTLHKKSSAYLTILVVSTFLIGLWDRIFYHGEPLFWQHTTPLITVVQGWFGLVVTIMAITQVVSCFVLKDKRKNRTMHMMLGYSLVIALVIQTFLGIGVVLIEIAGG